MQAMRANTFITSELNDSLAQAIGVFEQNGLDAVLFLPNRYRNSANLISMRLVALSDNCGLIGNRAFHPASRTNLELRFEPDEVMHVHGDAYQLHESHYHNPAQVHRNCLHATAFGRHKTYQFGKAASE